MKKPTIFLTQREGFWYLQGIKDAKERMNECIDSSIRTHNIDYIDHLPEGDKEVKCLRCDTGFIKPKAFEEMEDWTDAEYYCECCGAKYTILDDSGI